MTLETVATETPADSAICASVTRPEVDAMAAPLTTVSDVALRTGSTVAPKHFSKVCRVALCRKTTGQRRSRGLTKVAVLPSVHRQRNAGEMSFANIGHQFSKTAKRRRRVAAGPSRTAFRRTPGAPTPSSPTHGGGLAMRRDHTAEAASPTAATFLSRRGFLGAVGGGLAATTLAACGSGGGSTGSGSEIVFMNQSRGQAAALGQLARKYTQQTGVKIKIDDVGPADFLTKLQSSSQSHNMPDIYSAMDSFSMAPYYKAGWAMDLTERMKGSWGDTFRPATIKASTFEAGNSQGVKPGIYSAHWEAPALGIFINAAMFKAAGLDPDKPAATMSEFIDQLVKIKKSGKDPFWFA